MIYRICHLSTREARDLEDRGIVPNCECHDHVHADRAQAMVYRPYRNATGLWMESRWVEIKLAQAIERFGVERARELRNWLNYKAITDLEPKNWRSVPSGRFCQPGEPRACVMQMVRGASRGARFKPMFPNKEQAMAAAAS